VAYCNPGRAYPHRGVGTAEIKPLRGAGALHRRGRGGEAVRPRRPAQDRPADRVPAAGL